MGKYTIKTQDGLFVENFTKRGYTQGEHKHAGLYTKSIATKRMSKWPHISFELIPVKP